eukprot:5513062-Alexandrium_andersonii.AAC.1
MALCLRTCAHAQLRAPQMVDSTFGERCLLQVRPSWPPAPRCVLTCLRCAAHCRPRSERPFSVI